MKKPNVDKAIEFDHIWKLLAPAYMPSPVNEYKFCASRKFKFDRAWPDYRVAVEVDGGNYLAAINPKTGKPVAIGRHTQARDYEKLNIAASLGWRVLRFTPQMMRSNPHDCVTIVCEALAYADDTISVQT